MLSPRMLLYEILVLTLVAIFRLTLATSKMPLYRNIGVSVLFKPMSTKITIYSFQFDKNKRLVYSSFVTEEKSIEYEITLKEIDIFIHDCISLAIKSDHFQEWNRNIDEEKMDLLKKSIDLHLKDFKRLHPHPHLLVMSENQLNMALYFHSRYQYKKKENMGIVEMGFTSLRIMYPLEQLDESLKQCYFTNKYNSTFETAAYPMMKMFSVVFSCAGYRTIYDVLSMQLIQNGKYLSADSNELLNPCIPDGSLYFMDVKDILNLCVKPTRIETRFQNYLFVGRFDQNECMKLLDTVHLTTHSMVKSEFMLMVNRIKCDIIFEPKLPFWFGGFSEYLDKFDGKHREDIELLIKKYCVEVSPSNADMKIQIDKCFNLLVLRHTLKILIKIVPKNIILPDTLINIERGLGYFDPRMKEADVKYFNRIKILLILFSTLIPTLYIVIFVAIFCVGNKSYQIYLEKSY